MRITSIIEKLPLVLGACIILGSAAVGVNGQQSAVTMRVVIQSKAAGQPEKAAKPKTDPSDVVAWLKAVDAANAPPLSTTQKRWQLVQHNKSFQPHVLVVPVGSLVEFPNRDPYFHNVFSLFDGKRFDLGLYESGATNSVRFDRLGVSFLFCNIHPEMSAVVVAVDTNYFGVSDHNGNISIPNVPDGKYELHVYYERSLPEELRALRRTVTISSSSADLGVINVPENSSFSPTHKNKYGQDYIPPSSPGYSHP